MNAIWRLGALAFVLGADSASAADGLGHEKFGQLDAEWPTPGRYRSASGAPGSEYWQQRADYRIEVRIDDERQELSGEETITYHNRSPDTLTYLWVQIDNNIFAPNSLANLTETAPNLDELSFRQLRGVMASETFDGSANIRFVRDSEGDALEHAVVETMMRVNLRDPLEPGASTAFSVGWDFQLNESKYVRARTGYEYFERDENYIYEIAHWFPRMAAYSESDGWSHQQFLGRGEFTLEFGDYDVSITVPSDHVVAATGELVNADDVLSAAQRERLVEASEVDEPIFIVTPDEAMANEEERSEDEVTWRFRAKNVRDFAFATSRKFIWDAMGVTSGDNDVLAMSFYPNEGKALWAPYSTHAVAHTIDVYSKFTFDYPYPVAISVNGPVGGMEYPMICFNAPRNYEDGTYWGSPHDGDTWLRSKYGLISVIIHEVGHNYFPMIVNSDERQWTWMDEGLNTFLQYLAEKEWEEKYPSRRGEPRDITDYMSDRRQVPIMTQSDSILQFGNNAYAKPATALNILRETILGRDLFDFSFKEYSRRWMFKRPQPADLFRTIEDASGRDLDWFWRGWFYSTDACDLAITGVKRLRIDDGDPGVRKRRLREERAEAPQSLTESRNEPIEKRVDRFEGLKDFYNDYDPLDVTQEDRDAYEKYLESLDDEEKDALKLAKNFYVVDVENVGGLVMPILLSITYENGGKEERRIPAEIWRRDSDRVSKLIITDRPIASIELDPHWETADVDRSNNRYPPKIAEGWRPVQKIELDEASPMRQAREEDANDEAASESRDED